MALDTSALCHAKKHLSKSAALMWLYKGQPFHEDHKPSALLSPGDAEKQTVLCVGVWTKSHQIPTLCAPVDLTVY